MVNSMILKKLKFKVTEIQNMSFKRKLLFTYFLVALVPIVAWSLFNFNQINNMLETQTRSSLQTICDTVTKNLQTNIQEIDYTMRILANDKNVIALFSEGDYRIYETYLKLKNDYDTLTQNVININPRIEQIHIYSKSDLAGVRSQFLRVSNFISEDPELYEKIMTAQNNVWSFKNGKLYVYHRLIDLNSYTGIGIVRLQINHSEFFRNIINDLQNEHPLEVRQNDGTQLYQRNLQVLKDNKKQYFVSSREFQEQNWVLEIYSNTNSNTQFQKMFANTLVVILVSFMILMIVIFFFSANLTQRIIQLKTQVSKIASQQFSEDLCFEGDDEIGEIAKSVDAMIKESRQMISDVYESRVAQKEAELKALQAQINPHFLYNTLSLIKWKAIQHNGEDIARVVDALSAFYRRALNAGKTVTSVVEEIKMAQAYIEIQLFLHKHTIDVEWSVEESILDYDMPSVIIQPLIENAIEHGTDCLVGKKGKIQISGYSAGHTIVFEIADNGPGMTEQKIHEVLTDPSKGYGVRNVNDRIKLFFSEEYGVDFVCPKDGGTKAIVKIPKYIDCEG